MDIAIHNLTRTFGTLRANDTISLHFAAGKIHGILGENGAGKSTLMKLLAGFLQPDDGQIYLDDHQVSLDSPADALRAGIGMVYQEPLDVPAFTALENFFCASPRNRIPNRTVARQQLLHFAAELDFPVESDARIASLTIGQRQQLEIIRLLAAGARLLILDEPTTGITATQKAALFAALRRLATEGKTVLFVSHKLDEVDELCDTASVLRGGQVMGEGQMTMPQKRDHLLGLMFGQHQHQPTIAMPLQSFVPSLPHPVWRLQHVSLRSGNLSLHDISLDIRAGMVLGLAGVDGSGQQLLLHMLAGLIHPDEGTVLVNGKNMTAASLDDYQADGVQYVPADRMRDGLISSFSLTDHIALYYTTGLLLKNRQEAQSEAQEAIAEYDIRATPTTPMEDLSGGNQQRAMLALLPPRCTGLLLEQPTRGLDVASAGNIWQRLQARCADGTALVFTSPDLDELIEYSDSVLVFYSGRVSRAIPRAELNANRLAEMIGGIGFAENERPLPF